MLPQEDSARRAAWAAGILILFLSACSSVSVTRSDRRGLLEAGSGPAASSVGSKEKEPVRELASGSFRWPVLPAKITSPFGKRRRGFHEGVDLHASMGTAVHAAEEGQVIYAGRKIRGYGQMVVLRHASGWVTVYAHNSKLFVRKGEKVSRGQKIALSGKSGRATGPHVHFEVRRGIQPVDPADLLPQVAEADRGVAGKLSARADSP